MDNILLNDDFLDFVSSQMEKNSTVLDKIQEYKKLSENFIKANEMLENTVNKQLKILIDFIVNNLEMMSTYERAFAYYLGMKHSENMLELENSE